MQTYLIQVLMAILGSVGFAILFNIRGKKLLAIAFGGAVSWVVYLIAYAYYENAVISILISTIVVASLAELIARIIKTPVIILLVPMLIPLIPGSYFYYTMHNLIFGKMKESIHYLRLALEEAGAIACGIILVAFLIQFITKTKNYFLNRKLEKDV